MTIWRRKGSFAAAMAVAGGGVAILVLPAMATDVHSAGPRVLAGTETPAATTITDARADDIVRLRFRLAPTNAKIAACMPKARVDVDVRLAEEKTGRDLVRVEAGGLLPNTTFTVFFVQKPADPFGAVEYVGDLETNRSGTARVDIRAITEEAFASTLVKGKRVRVDLNHLGIWFADPAGDDGCFGKKGGGKVTPFDGDGKAGVQAFNSANILPAAPLP